MKGQVDGGDLLRITSIGLRQLGLLALGILVLFADGFDAQMAGLIAPTMSNAWHLPRPAFAPVFAINVAGLMIGSMGISIAADMFGRKRITTVCVAAFGITSLAAAAVTTIGQFAAIRFLSGLALGGAMPCMIAATSDYFPMRYRTRLAVLLAAAWSIGIAACGVVTALLIADHGWRSICVVGAVLPLLLAPALALWLPESPAFLIRTGQTEQLRRILSRLVPTLRYEPGALLPQRTRSPLAALFTGSLAQVTASLWLAYFAAGATIYFFLNWLPIFVASVGYSAGQAASVTSIYQIGGIVGAIVISIFVDRGGALALAGSALAAAVAVFVLATMVQSLSTLLVFTAIAGAAIVGSQNSANAYTGTRLYPTEIRATGLGWALGWVRFSGVLAGSLGGGFLMTLEMSPANTLRVIALPEMLAALGYFGVFLALRRNDALLHVTATKLYEEAN